MVVCLSVLLTGCEKNQAEPTAATAAVTGTTTDPSPVIPAVGAVAETRPIQREEEIVTSPQVQPVNAARVADGEFDSSMDSSQCAEMIAQAKTSGKKHFVVSFEGLASHGIGYVRRNLMQKLESEFGRGFATINYGWRQSSKAHACAVQWARGIGEGHQISVIGHSFGAGIATFDFAEKLGQSGLKIRYAVTLDPRNWTNDAKFMSSREFHQYTKPANVEKHINFWQGGGLRGYGVSGADNHEIKDSGHTGLPSNTKVHGIVRALFLAEIQAPISVSEPVALQEESDPGFGGLTD
jgi:hypothetical protein